MKRYFHALLMCRSMFCAIPCAWHTWDEDARDKMLLFLPVVGLEIGLLWALLALLCWYLALPAAVTGVVLGAYPFIATGFIHLDGFMDVTDAVRSCRDLARRREILKDSHVGSFAVIGIVLLALCQTALFASAKDTADVWTLLLLPAVSRCGSALAVTILPPMSTSQYAAQKKPRSHIVVLCVQLAVYLAAGFLLGWRSGLALVGCMCGYALALRKAYRSLEGMNGDISGYSLTLAELCGAAVWALL